MSTASVIDLFGIYIDKRLAIAYGKTAFVDCLPDCVQSLEAVNIYMPTEHMIVIEVFEIDQSVLDTMVLDGWTLGRPVVMHGKSEISVNDGVAKQVVFKEQCEACFRRANPDLTESQN